MVDIVISEFMDHAAVADLSQDFEVRYDPRLVERPDELNTGAAEARGVRRVLAAKR